MKFIIPDSLRLIFKKIIDSTQESYLIGGAVRDFLLEKESFDFDIVTNIDGYTLAKRLAAQNDSEFAYVPLDANNKIGRLQSRNDGFTLDISKFKGDNLIADVLNRDFTINTLAMDLHTAFHASPKIIDYAGGIEDLRNHRLRPCSPNLYIDDPLRILRAFRFAAHLNFNIDERNKPLIEQSLPLLAGISGERIRDELTMIFSCQGTANVLRDMEELRVAISVFPELMPMKGCEQNRFHHLDVWEHSLEAIRMFEKIVTNGEYLFENSWPMLDSYLNAEM